MGRLRDTSALPSEYGPFYWTETLLETRRHQLQDFQFAGAERIN